ncbi:Mu transposase C-terminal domain-containing protein, partial [Staphylococcus aureus]|uniref:Mu transposase C-terminal domain-containing protein n=1 Tax=Staphylococcus aureus TaxID=1280 RepID=UPI00301BC015
APELFEYVGQQAVIKRDEADIGRVFVYVEGEFVAVAECAELLGISRKERAAAARAAQKRFIASQQSEYRQFKKGVDRNIGRVVLDHQLEQIENIETLHRPSIDYSPEGLRQAGRAASRELPPMPEPPTPEQTDARAQLVAEMASEPAPVAEVDTPRRRFDRWLRLDRRAQDGERLPEAEAAFHRSYPASDEYRSRQSFYTDFDLGAQGERP